jgi:hypothetical protein
MKRIVSTKILKKKFTWNNLKESHNNLIEHGTKKLNAFKEIMDL